MLRSQNRHPPAPLLLLSKPQSLTLGCGLVFLCSGFVGSKREALFDTCPQAGVPERNRAMGAALGAEAPGQLVGRNFISFAPPSMAELIHSVLLPLQITPASLGCDLVFSCKVRFAPAIFYADTRQFRCHPERSEGSLIVFRKEILRRCAPQDDRKKGCPQDDTGNVIPPHRPKAPLVSKGAAQAGFSYASHNSPPLSPKVTEGMWRPASECRSASGGCLSVQTERHERAVREGTVVVANCTSLAPPQAAGRVRSVVPPLQIESDSLGFDLVFSCKVRSTPAIFLC